jgi:hypothetical protein
MRVRPGKAAAALDLVNEWNRNFRPNIRGAVGTYLLMADADPDVLIGTVIFADRRSYRQNAESPTQDAWFRRMRELLVEDPQWEDGEYIIGSI